MGLSVVVDAQSESVLKAYDFFSKNELDSAKVYIDKAILSSNDANDPQTWQVKGFIYKGIYNKKKSRKSALRIEALNALKTSISLDKKKDYYSDNIAGIKYLVNTLHNDAAHCLDPTDYKLAIDLFEIETEYLKVIDSSLSFIQPKQVEFFLALASVYQSMIPPCVDGAPVPEYFYLAKDTYSKILKMEPDNKGANYNMGVLIYNLGVCETKSKMTLVDSTNSLKGLKKEHRTDSVSKSKLNDLDSSKYTKAMGLFKESFPYMTEALTTSLFFDLNKATLKKSSYKTLDSIINNLGADTTCFFIIEGYTDNPGSSDYNLMLSGKRAKAVKQYLIKKGIKSSRITIRALGESVPVYPNSSLQSRAKNRRVKIKLEKHK